MADYTIKVAGIGTTANDGTGDTLRTGFDKLNDNWASLAGALTWDSATYNAAFSGDLDVNGSNFRLRLNGSSLTHAFSYNENGGELILYDETATAATILDQSTDRTRLIALTNGSNMDIGLDSGNTTGIVLFRGAGGVNALNIDTSNNVNVTNSLDVGSNAVIQGDAEIRSGNDLIIRPLGNAWDYRINGVGTSLAVFSGGDLVTPVATFNNDKSTKFGGNIDIGTVSVGNDFVNISASAASQFGISTATGTQFTFFTNVGSAGSISHPTSTSTAYNTSSDPRLKSEFRPISGALTKIEEAVDNKYIGEFDWLADGSTTWGYDAHALLDNQVGFGGSEGAGPRDLEIGEVYDTIDHPALFNEDGTVLEDAWTEELKVLPAGVDQSKRVPMLEAAIYELLQRVKVLENGA